MSEKGFLIGPAFAGALKDLVDKDRSAVVRTEHTKIPTRFDEPVGRAAGKTFRICTFTGSWAIDTDKAVTFKGVTTTPNTVTVRNLFCGLNPSGTCDVSVAKDGTAWYLVQPNLTQQPGYSASGTQVLAITSGNLRWVGTTACA